MESVEFAQVSCGSLVQSFVCLLFIFQNLSSNQAGLVVRLSAGNFFTNKRKHVETYERHTL
jgi:hypothetical protein